MTGSSGLHRSRRTTRHSAGSPLTAIVRNAAGAIYKPLMPAVGSGCGSAGPSTVRRGLFPSPTLAKSSGGLQHPTVIRRDLGTTEDGQHPGITAFKCSATHREIVNAAMSRSPHNFRFAARGGESIISESVSFSDIAGKKVRKTSAESQERSSRSNARAICEVSGKGASCDCRIKARIEKLKKQITDPQTLDDFEATPELQGIDKLTPRAEGAIQI